MVSVLAPPPEPGSVDALLRTPLDDLSDAALAEHVLALHAATARIDAARAATIGRFDARAVWAQDGDKSGPGWVAARTGASYGLAKADQHLARDLRDMPLVEAAFASGRLSRDQVRILAKARLPELAAAFAACEQILVDQIAELTVAAGIRFLRRWEAEVRRRFGIGEPDGPEPSNPGASSRVRLSPVLDGVWRLEGDLCGEDGEIIRNVVDAQVDAMWRDGVFTAEDGLSGSERFAMAMVEVLVRGSQGGEDDGVARPLVVVVAHAQEPYRMAAHAEHAPIPAGLSSAGRVPKDLIGLAELEHAGLVHPADVDRWICEGTVQVLAIDDGWDDMRMGWRMRIATRAQRRALRARDGGCVFPGCHVSASHCVAHHVRWWEHGGVTDTQNLVLVCRFHHKAVHDRGFVLTRTDGQVQVTRPDGTPLTPARSTRPDPTLRPILPPAREPDADEALLHRLITRRRHRLATEARQRRAPT